MEWRIIHRTPYCWKDAVPKEECQSVCLYRFYRMSQKGWCAILRMQRLMLFVFERRRRPMNAKLAHRVKRIYQREVLKVTSRNLNERKRSCSEPVRQLFGPRSTSKFITPCMCLSQLAVEDGLISSKYSSIIDVKISWSSGTYRGEGPFKKGAILARWLCKAAT